MELKKYFYPLRRWWWLLVAATLVAGISSFLVTLQQPPIYQSKTTMMIGRAIEDPNPAASEFYLGQQLAAAYADIATRDLVVNATKDALGLKWLPEYTAIVVPNSQLIELAVTDTNPERAQLVASELANQLILQSPTSTRPDQQSRFQFVTKQLDTLEVQITDTEVEITKLQEELGNMVSARQINDTQNQISALQAKLTTLQSNYGALLSNTQAGAINTLSVIEPAAVPTRPIGPNKLMSILAAAVIGFSLAAAAAYLLEYLDDSIKDPEMIEKVIGHPILGYVSEIEEEEDAAHPFVSKFPRHPITEAYRSIRTNLEFASVDQPLKTLLVTSSDAEEGKTSVAANLAVILAQGDKRVVLIDADLRRPSIHQFMSMTNDAGLSEVFRGRVSLQTAMRIWKNEKLAVITGGVQPPNPAELLSSKKMDQILASLKDVADIIIIDGPPFAVADAAVLSSKVDGVLLVLRPGYSERMAVKSMMDQIQRAGARVVGVVVNRVPRKMMGYYGQFSLSPYYTASRYGETPHSAPLTWQQSLQKWFTGLTKGRSKPAVSETKVVPRIEAPPKRGNE